jgi:SAM-dependent methyltransferase
VSDLREAWDEQAQAWAAWARTPGVDELAWAVNIPEFLGLLPPAGRRTLDLGCGEGRLGRALAGRGHRVVGIDASPTLARLAREAGGFEEVVTGDAAALPFADGAFDLVVAFMTPQDMDDLEGALREAARVLAPGGRLALATVHPLNSFRLHDGASYFSRFRYSDPMERGGVAVVFHSVHLPLADLLGAVLDAGLVLEALREPRVPAEAARGRRDPEGIARRPLWLHLLARRPQPSA